MPTTYTVTNYSEPIRSPQFGAFTITRTHVMGGRSQSVSDVIYLTRLAADTYVYDGYVTGIAGGAAPTVKVGIPGNDDLFTGAITMVDNTIVRFAGGDAALMPAQATLSADAEGLLAVPVILTRVTGTSTVTGVVQVTLFCQRRGAI